MSLLYYLEKDLFVELFAGGVLNEFDDLFHLRKSVFIGGLVLPTHGNAGNGGRYLDAALDKLAVHGR